MNSRRIENSFNYTLNRLFKSIEEFVRNPKDEQTVIRRLKIYGQTQEFKDWCDELALKMTTQVYQGVSATWREAALKAGRGNEFYAAILEDLKTPNGGVFFQTVRQNAELLKTFPLDLSQDLTEFIANEGMMGRRSGDILNDLVEQFPDTAKTRLNLIARTEVSKTQSAFTQARATSLGLNWYIWRTSEDVRVRSAHGHMEGVLVNWNDPPNPEELFPQKNAKPYGSYHAGNTFNCRCYAEVVIDLDFVEFPARVYHARTIERMPRLRFEKIM